MAYKCPKRKEVVKQKIKEKKEKTLKIPEGDIRRAVERQIREDLPENYLVVVASAVTLAEIREKECPGTYQYIMDELYIANGLPLVKFPATVVAGYEHYKTKNRTREASDPMQEGEGEGELIEYMEDITLHRALSTVEMEPPTPIQSPASTPAGTPLATLAGTPAQSPVRVSSLTIDPVQAVRPKDKRPPPGPQRTKERRVEIDAGVVLFTYKESRLPKQKLDHNSKVSLLKNSQLLKYIYRDRNLDSRTVWNYIQQRKINLTHNVIYEVEKGQFDKVSKGSYLDLRTEKLSMEVWQL